MAFLGDFFRAFAGRYDDFGLVGGIGGLVGGGIGHCSDVHVDVPYPCGWWAWSNCDGYFELEMILLCRDLREVWCFLYLYFSQIKDRYQDAQRSYMHNCVAINMHPRCSTAH